MGSVNMASEFLGARGGDLTKYNAEWRNAPLDAPVIEGANGERIIGLHDPRKRDVAMVGLQKEQPWYRMAAYMLNKGFTNIEVADAAGVSKEQVSTLRAQRWFNELCATLATNKDAEISARLKSYAVDAVEAIAATAFDNSVDKDGNSRIPARVRLAAQTTLLEHANGKPTQKVLTVSATTNFSSEREEYDAIMQELKSIQAPTQQPTQ